jgi:outer membrane biogenesis lipoprotein LolB
MNNKQSAHFYQLPRVLNLWSISPALVTLFLFILLSACRNTKNAQKSNDDTDSIVYTLEPVSLESKPIYKGSAKKDFIQKHTKLELTPDWQTHTLKGKADLTIQVGAYPQDTLVLDA